MNTLTHFLFLSIGLPFVICDQKADIECIKNGNKALDGKSDQELYDLTQQNLQIGKQMVQKRADTANSNGLPCYKQFYDKYVKGLDDVLINGEKQRLDKAKTPKERSDATKALAGITQAMRCDEDWRAQHFNETIKSAECTASEAKTTSLNTFNFRPKFALLQTGLSTGKFALRFKNNVLSGIVGELLSLYRNLYSEGEKCAKSQSSAADKCRNLKMFIKELDRLFYLFQTTLLTRG